MKGLWASSKNPESDQPLGSLSGLPQGPSPRPYAPTGRLRRSRLASLLLAEGMVDEDTLRAAQERQRGAKRPLFEILIEQGALTEEQYVNVLAAASGLKVVSADDLDPDPSVQDLVPMEIAQRLGILPLHVSGGELVVATGDPYQLPAFDELAARTDLRVRPVFAPPSAVREALRRARGGEESLHDLLKHAPDPEADVVVPASAPSATMDASEESSDGSDVDTLTLDSEGEDAPVIRLLNLILTDAIRQGASDIHIEPERNRVRIRFRVDGDLHEALELPGNVRRRLLSRLKIVSQLKTTETRRPQDGRAKVALGGRTYDLRVSTIPSYFGEKAVIRILDAHAKQFDLDNSGVDEPELEIWRDLLHRPQGLLLVTGPTGSGKSTTLYASLLELRDTTKNIVTVEDPVEYQFPGIVHVPVRSDIGMTFAAALRSILRQDPDIVLVGEIRDAETAEVAMRAAMTGHLVLSTLHTNDAVSTLGRLLDLGVSPQILSTCLLGIMAQRLLMTNCSECSRPFVFSPALLDRLQSPLPPDVNERTQKGEGCDTCRGTGYKGRTAIVELAVVTPTLQAMIADSAPETELLAQTQRDGTGSLFQSAIGKLLDGRTTPEAILRVAAPPVGTVNTASEAGARENGIREESVVEPVSPPLVVPETAGPTVPHQGECLNCGEPLRTYWRVCPFCGTPVEEKPKGPIAVVCDDSATVRRLVRAALEPLCGEIVEADNGRSGLDAVSRAHADLLVVDHEMPEMTGKEVIRHLRSRLATATLPIMMLTAIDDADLESEVLEEGADDYLRKPITVARLRVRARSLLAAVKRRAPRTEDLEIPCE